MLATPWESPFADDEWIFELKWDGIRCLLSSDDDGVHLRSRAGNDMTLRYPELAGEHFPANVVLDGEIVVLDDAGRPSFELLQGRTHALPGEAASLPISYVVFDVLHCGDSLTEVPLEGRFRRLADLDLPAGCVIPDRFEADPGPLWAFVISRGLEGIVAKRRGSRYSPGVRSPHWRKIGNFLQTRAVVGGFTPGTGGRAASFGALLLGLWTDDGMRWIGSVGSGFDDEALRAIRSALDEMTIADCPFAEDPELPQAVTWVDPQLVAVVRFKQWTRAGRLRAPSFKGFSDHSPRSATWIAEGPSHAE